MWASACAASDAWTSAIAANKPRFGGPAIVIQPLGLPTADPGTSRRRQAEAIVADASAQVSRSSQVAAEFLDQLSEGLPDGQWHAASFFAGLGTWVKDLAASTWTTNPWRAVFDRDGYMESARANAAGMVGVYDLATTDPGALPDALLDTEGRHDDPARWWGKAAPDIALAALGVGAIGATTVGKLQTAARLFEGIPGTVGRTGVVEVAVGAASAAPSFGSLSNVEARVWYLAQERRIAASNAQMLEAGASPELRARAAFDARNAIRTQAREAMSNRKAAEALAATESNLTWEQVVGKYNGDYEAIAEAASRSRPAVNQQLGLEP